MQYRYVAGLAALLSAAAMPLWGQDAAAPSGTASCPKEVAELATCFSAKLPTGAYVLAAMPKTWNGNLIVYAHGGPSLEPPAADGNDGGLAKYAVEIERGFAWVASTYRMEGFGVQMAAADTDDARKFFIERVARPKRTILHGASYGGMVGVKLLEKYARGADGSLNYDGAFFNSGVVGGAFFNYEFRADLRAVYQYYCNNLPRPDEAQYPLWMGLPADSKLTLADIRARVDECTGGTKPASERSEAQQRNLANILGVMRVPERMLLRHMQAATFTFREIAERIANGKSVFSNRNVTYRGSSDDSALNAGVARFDADPEAVAALKADAVPAGTLSVPVVSIHSLNDPQAAVEAQYEYRKVVTDAGNGRLLVQAYTDENGHTAQSAPEIAAALEALLAWIEKGAKPTPQSIASTCDAMRAKFDGPCRYHPEYEPKPYSTRFARSASLH